jgi:uncharacterized phage protein (TIGR02216 family)
MGLGLGAMRLSPAAFWAMTPRELSAAVGVLSQNSPTTIAWSKFQELMRRYPD